MNILNNTSASPNRRAFLVNSAFAAAGLALTPALTVAARRRAGTSFLEWEEVRPGIFALDAEGTGGNCLAVAGGDGAVLVDTKFPIYARQLARDAAGLTGKRLTRVINTHHHGDHTGGNVAFAGHLPVIAHINAVSRVERQFERSIGGITRANQELLRIPEEHRETIAADVRGFTDNLDSYTPKSWMPNTTVVVGRTGLDLDGRWMEMIHFGFGAHTDNDLVVHLPADNVVHTGDLVFNGLHPFFDPACANAQGWMATLREVLDICDDETVVVPGHGSITDIEGVRAQLRYIEQLWENVEAEIDAGKAVDEVQQMTWPFMEGLGFESIRERSIAFVYAEIEELKQ